MEQMTKQQLADRICQALFQNEYITKDDCNGIERLGYLNLDYGSTDALEPLLLYISDNGVELHWMFGGTTNIDDIGSYLKGMMRAVAPHLSVEDFDERSLIFGYSDVSAK